MFPLRKKCSCLLITWLDLLKTVDLVTFTEEFLMENFIFCTVIHLFAQFVAHLLALSQPKNESNLYLPKLYFSFQQCYIELSESFSMNVMRVSSIPSRVILQKASQEKASIWWNTFVVFFCLTHFGPLLKVH